MAPTVLLSDTERTWIQAHPAVVLAIDDAYPPRNFFDSQGQLVGINIDYVKLLAARVGLEVRFEASPWKNALARAMNHEVDGIVNADMLDERKSSLAFSDVYVACPQALAVREDEPRTTKLASFGGRKVAAIEKSSQAALLRDRCPDVQVVPVNTLDEALNQLTEGNVDGVYDDVAVLHRLVSKRFATNVRFADVHYDPPIGYARLGLDNTKPELLSLFNKAIGSLTDADHRRIQRTWMALELPRQLGIADELRLELSDDEKDWLLEHPVVRVAADGNYCPVEFLDAVGHRHGLAIDYLARIEEILHIRFDFVSDKTWAEMVEMGRRREVDMFSCIANTAERRSFLLFTDPYLSLPIAVFGKTSMPYTEDLSELKGKRVGIVDSYSAEEWLRRDYPAVTGVPVLDVRDGLRQLHADRIDVFADTLLCGDYYLGELGHHDIRVVGLTPYTDDLCMAVRSDWPTLAHILDKALRAIPTEDKNVIRARWMSAKYTPPFDYSIVWKTAGAVLLAFTLLIAWNHRLRIQVRRRTLDLTKSNESLSFEIETRKMAEIARERLIVELQEALTEVKTLSGLLPICAHCKKVRDDKGYWTQLERYIHEHSNARFSHGICPNCIQEFYPQYASRVLHTPPPDE